MMKMGDSSELLAGRNGSGRRATAVTMNEKTHWARNETGRKWRQPSYGGLQRTTTRVRPGIVCGIDHRLMSLTHLQRLESIHILRESSPSVKPGDALLHQQGQRRDAAPGDERFIPRGRRFRCSRRHDVGVPRDDRFSAIRRWPSSAQAHRLHQPGRDRRRHRSLHARLGRPHRRAKDAGAQAGAFSRYGFDAAIGGARRDEEKSRAPRARVLVPVGAAPLGSQKRQRPELWRLYNARVQRGESQRVFPLSSWTELDVWQYIYLERSRSCRCTPPSGRWSSAAAP